MLSRRTPGGILRWLALGLAVIALILVAGKFYTDALVRAAEREHPPTAFVAVEGVRLHYLQAGQGPPVVILHGSGGLLQDFAKSPLLPLLAAEYRVTIFDRPGLGYSQKPADEAPTPAVQARLHGAFAGLGLRQPVLVGQSWGGVIALAYAEAYPGEVAGLVLLGSAPYPRDKTPTWFDRLALLPGVGDALLHTLYVPLGRHWLAPRLLAQNVDVFAPLETTPPGFAETTLTLGLRPSHLKARAMEQVVIPPYLAEVAAGLGAVTAPVMIVVGELDTPAIEVAPRLREDLAASRLVTVAGANHFLWFAHPEVVAAAVRDVSTWAAELKAAGE